MNVLSQYVEVYDFSSEISHIRFGKLRQKAFSVCHRGPSRTSFLLGVAKPGSERCVLQLESSEEEEDETEERTPSLSEAKDVSMQWQHFYQDWKPVSSSTEGFSR